MTKAGGLPAGLSVVFLSDRKSGSSWKEVIERIWKKSVNHKLKIWWD